MDNCKECGRPLEQGEKDLCPACKSTKSHKKKKLAEIGMMVVGGVVAVAVTIIKLVNAKKGGGNA